MPRQVMRRKETEQGEDELVDDVCKRGSLTLVHSRNFCLGLPNCSGGFRVALLATYTNQAV